MNLKLKALTAGVLFFTGHALFAQEVAKDSTSTGKDVKEIKEVEIVVLGYGKKSDQKKSSAASTTISASTLEGKTGGTLMTAMQGAAPGLSINSSSGSPGSGKINVSIRGLGSLGASTDPLYVIDGVISSGSEFRNLNENDIETFSVLKDAQATSIYGNYGANGVVVITTKAGRFGSGLKISYSALTSTSELPKHKYSLASGRELLTIQNRLGVSKGATMSQAEIDAYDINTNWEKEFFKMGYSHQHNLGINYGAANFSSYTSLGYLESKGTLKTSDFQRFTLRNNISGRSKNKKFSYTTNIGLGYSKRHQTDSETNDGVRANSIQNPLLGAVNAPSFLEPYRFANGLEMYEHLGSNFSGRNVWVLADVLNGGVKNRFTQTSITVNGSASYEFVKGLTITNRTGLTYKHNVRNFARDPHGYLALIVAASQKAEYGGWERITNSFDTTVNSITNLTYEKKFGAHSFTLGAYLDYLRGFYSSDYQEQNGLDPLTWKLGSGTGYIPFNPSTPELYRPENSLTKVKAGTLAYIGTLEYDYDSKYGISGTIRRDGSYRFADGRKWDTFWSVAGRWNIERESFMEGGIFDLLKLRASYGTNGNQNLSVPSNNVNPLFLDSNLVRDTYSTNTGYLNLPGYAVALKNSKLKWEKVSQFNVGLDFQLFNRRLEGGVDYYIKTTSDMFLSVPISATTGSYTIKGNNGKMRNTGIEASLKYQILKGKDTKLSVFANTGYNKNKIITLPAEDLSGENVSAIGGPARQWNIIRYVGVNPLNGEHLFLDKNGNITEDVSSADRVLTGKSSIPKFVGGFGLSFEHKGFFADARFSYQAGGWSFDNMYTWLNLTAYAGNNLNVTNELLDAWTPNNPTSQIAALKAKNREKDGDSDKYLAKTDFIKLKTLSIGYNVTKDLLRGTPIKALKVYVSGDNLFMWTGWKGFDPEPVGNYSLGVYPNPRTYSLGVNVEF